MHKTKAMNTTNKPTTRLEYYQEFKQMDEAEFVKTQRLLRLMKVLSSYGLNFAIGFVLSVCIPTVAALLITDNIAITQVVGMSCIVAYPIVFFIRSHKRIESMREEYCNARDAYEDVLAEKR